MNNINNAERITIDNMDLSVYSKRGPLKPSHLLAIKQTFDNALKQYPRTLLLRIDLRYPQGFSSEKVSSKQITKFQESFKAIMCAYLKRKTHNRHSKPRFIWCKEVVTSETPHYHVAVLLNGDVFQGIGPYDDIKGEYVSGMIAKAWASATGLSVEQASRAIYYPNNGTYEINKRLDEEAFYNQYNQAFYRVSYFAKKESKLPGNGRSFGYSRY
ncbi:inovirus Gp2 family protein [Vibrio diabolicus]|uniref:inovirus Gp2 family protein n=1 Tax=Vibrio diabolicus TaxID=50719 RepID=UPI002941A1DC|nr:inovirus Gp2 family protein [Vibrio diabolicus]MDV5047419.1 inovirus Gp2 family protein [Vibrio diabolicus]